MFRRLISYYKNNPYLSLITLACIIIYYWHINFGAIQSIYPDEAFFDLYAFKIIDYIRGNGIDYGLDPSMYSVCLAIAYGFYFVIGFLTGQFHNLNEFIIQFAVHRENFVIIGRMVSAFFAVCTIPLTYYVAEKLSGKSAAIIAASGLAICYPLVWFSHTVHHTTISACISVVILYFSLKVWKEGKTFDYFITGIMIGLGIGIKLYPGLFALSLVMVHFYRNPLISNNKIQTKNLFKLFLCSITALLSTFIFYPWPLIETKMWSESIKHTNVFFTGGNLWDNLYYLFWGKSEYYSGTSAEPFSFWSNSLRIVSETTLIMMCFSILYVFIRKRRIFMIFMLPFVIFLIHHIYRGGLAMGTRQFYFLLPCMYICMGIMISDFFDTIKQKYSNIIHKSILVISVIIVFAQPILWLIQYMNLLTHPTTLEIGRDWMRKNIPDRSMVLVNYSAPYANITNWYENNGELKEKSDPAYQQRKLLLPPFTVKRLNEIDYSDEVDSLKNHFNNIYIVLTDYNSTEYYQYDNAKLWGLYKYWKAPDKEKYFNAIYFNSIRLFSIYPKDYNALGPVIHIYKLR